MGDRKIRRAVPSLNNPRVCQVDKYSQLFGNTTHTHTRLAAAHKHMHKANTILRARCVQVIRKTRKKCWRGGCGQPEGGRETERRKHNVLVTAKQKHRQNITITFNGNVSLWERGLESVLHGSTRTAGRESKLYVLDMRSAQSFKAEESQKVGQVRWKRNLNCWIKLWLNLLFVRRFPHIC